MELNMHIHNQSGFLITFCGLDGCGKTTQITLLKEALEKMEMSVFLTKQPTDFVRNSEIFRNYMDQADHDNFDYRALSLLCASDRIQHCHGVIQPLLKEGNIVLSDRYFYSCLANLRARGYVEDEWIYEIARSALKPDLSFFLDVPVETAVTRVRQRLAERDRYIDIGLQYRLRKEYIALAKENGGILLDSRETPAKTHEHILQAVIQKIDARKLRIAQYI